MASVPMEVMEEMASMGDLIKEEVKEDEITTEEEVLTDEEATTEEEEGREDEDDGNLGDDEDDDGNLHKRFPSVSSNVKFVKNN